MSSFWDQSLGAVIYSTLSETPLPGGRVIVCMQMLIILSCPEFGMWIIPPVQWRSRREEREGRNWNSSSAPHPPTSQPLAPVIFSAMKLKMSLYWRRPASEYIGILSLSRALNWKCCQRTEETQVFCKYSIIHRAEAGFVLNQQKRNQNNSLVKPQTQVVALIRLLHKFYQFKTLAILWQIPRNILL